MHAIWRKRTLFWLLLLLGTASPLAGQGLGADSTALPVRDRDVLVRPMDSLAGVVDSSDWVADSLVAVDSMAVDSSGLVAGGRKKSGLNAPVFIREKDSMVYLTRVKTLSLYGQGDVKYTDKQILAEDILLDMNIKQVQARGAMVDPELAELDGGGTGAVVTKLGASGGTGATGDSTARRASLRTDSLGRVYKRPEFIDAEQSYELDSVHYNFDTEKALIWGGRAQEGEGFLTGGTIKKMPDDVLHLHGGHYTTCDAPTPHFWLQITKGTIEPGKKVVFGPAYLYIEEVPFYILGLPFGFFPQQGERNSGFIIPSFGEENLRGFYLREGGYYHVFNDYLDAKLTGGIYTLGSWEANFASSYRKQYKFSGNVGFDYAKTIYGEKGSADYQDLREMRIRWSHSQDAKFRPNSTFSASVNYSTSQYNKYNAVNMNDYLSAQTSSSIAYSKNWAGKPFSLSINANHSQSFRDSTVSLSLPGFTFNVSRISPFKRKVAMGRERWYEKISFTYSTQFKNSARFKQDQFFKQDMIDNLQTGFQHQLPVSASFNLFNSLNLTPSLSYTERWYFKKTYQTWNPQTERIEPGEVQRGFYRLYDYNFSVSANTRLYGMYTFGGRKTGKPVQLRHVLTPSVSFSFRPDFGQAKYGYYETVQRNPQGDPYQYSPFSSEPYGVPGSGKNMSMSFSLGNTLEMKVPSSRQADTTGYRKLKLIEAFNLSGSYNFLADSLQLSQISANLRTTVVKNISINLNATFDPYQTDGRGDRINRFYASTGKGLARLTNFSTGFSYGWSSPTRSTQVASNNPNTTNRAAIEAAASSDPGGQNAFFSQTENQYAQAMRRAQMLASQYYDFNIPWSASFSYSFSFARGRNTISRSQTVSFNGSVNLTAKWAVEFGGGYDFIQQKMTPGPIMIRRDLHCFQATFSWWPVGFRQSWNFSFRAKTSVLADLLKYKKTNSFLDNLYYY